MYTGTKKKEKKLTHIATMFNQRLVCVYNVYEELLKAKGYFKSTGFKWCQAKTYCDTTVDVTIC